MAGTLMMGKCLGSTLRQTIKVAVPRLKFDAYLKMHFRENEELMAHDHEEKAKAGDWVLVKELPQRLSLDVKHRLERVVYESGNILDPLTGKRCVGIEYAEDVDRSSKFFGLKPLLERFPQDGAQETPIEKQSRRK